MSLTKALVWNSGVQVAGKAASTALGFVVIAIVARALGPTGAGHYYTALAFLQIIGVLADLGLYIVLIKKLAEDPTNADAWASTAFTLRLITAAAILIIAPVVGALTSYPGDVKVGIAIGAFSTFAIVVNQVLVGIFQRGLQMGRVVIAEIVGRVVLLGATLAVAATHPTVPWVLGAVAIGALANLAFSFWFSRGLVRIRLVWDKLRMMTIVREGWPIALSVGFNLVYFKTDMLVLAATHPASDAGLYGQANKVLEVLATFPAMLAGLLTPILANAFASQDRQRFRSILQRAVDGLALLAFPLAVGTPFVAVQVMRLSGGEEFTAASGALTALMVATAVIFFGNLFANTVVAVGQQRRMLWGYMAVAIGALVAYLLAIPAVGMMAGAYIRVASEVVITVIAMLLVFRTVHIRLDVRACFRIALACVAMALVLWVTPNWLFLPRLAIAVGVYGIALLLLRAIPSELLGSYLKRFAYAR